LPDPLKDEDRIRRSSGWARPAGIPRPPLALVAALLLLIASNAVRAGHAQTAQPAPQLPEAPQPQPGVKKSAKAPQPCKTASAAKPSTATPAAGATPPISGPPNAQSAVQPCPKQPVIDWLARFLSGPEVKPLTPKEKARLAVRNVLDPFNAVTILGQSAIAVGSDAHSPYGPGMPGFARNVGVSYTQDITGEFFGTFLIPSIVHQDPHYHRMPNTSIPRRFGHAIAQVVWTQGDNGKGMLNYANLVGFAFDDEISNLYVPGRATNLPASAARYGTGLAIAPTDNFITEFLPDVARHIHVRVVLVQRIIDQVAKTESAGSP
jgi:hypothetical protein